MDYPSNSNKARTDGEEDEKKPGKAEPKKVERVTSGEVVRRKKSLGKRFKETFVGGDTKGVMSYVFMDVLIPAAKDMVSDATSEAVQRMLFGDARSNRRNRNRSHPNGYVSYNRYGSGSSSSGSRPPWDRDRDRDEPRNVSRRARATHDFDEIILETRGEAEEVIDRLFDLVSRYESATVADLYELTGITGSFTDDKWGWSDIRGAGVTRVRGGYLLDLPKPEPLD